MRQLDSESLKVLIIATFAHAHTLDRQVIHLLLTVVNKLCVIILRYWKRYNILWNGISVKRVLEILEYVQTLLFGSLSRRLKKIRKENWCWCTARNSGSEAHEKGLELKLWNAGEYPVNDLGCILFMFYDNAIWNALEKHPSVKVLRFCKRRFK